MILQLSTYYRRPGRRVVTLGGERIGIVERVDDDQWRLDLEDRIGIAYDVGFASLTKALQRLSRDLEP